MTCRTALAARVCLLGLVLTSFALRAQDISPEQGAAVREGIQATLDAYRELAAAGRWDDLVKLYVEDPRFRWVESGAVVARSVGEIRRYLATLPAGARIETTFEETEILAASPGVAEVVTRFRTRVADAQGRGYSFGGVMTMTLVQHREGWKILSGHASSAGDRSPAEKKRR
jgi:hypothetical protein